MLLLLLLSLLTLLPLLLLPAAVSTPRYLIDGILGVWGAAVFVSALTDGNEDRK